MAEAQLPIYGKADLPAPTPNLADVVNDPSLIARIPSQSIHTLRGELAALDSALLARLIHGAVEEEQQRKGTRGGSSVEG